MPPRRAAVRLLSQHVHGAENSAWHAGSADEHWLVFLSLPGRRERGPQPGNSESSHHLEIKKLEKVVVFHEKNAMMGFVLTLLGLKG